MTSGGVEREAKQVRELPSYTVMWETTGSSSGMILARARVSFSSAAMTGLCSHKVTEKP